MQGLTKEKERIKNNTPKTSNEIPKFEYKEQAEKYIKLLEYELEKLMPPKCQTKFFASFEECFNSVLKGRAQNESKHEAHFVDTYKKQYGHLPSKAEMEVFRGRRREIADKIYLEALHEAKKIYQEQQDLIGEIKTLKRTILARKAALQNQEPQQ